MRARSLAMLRALTAAVGWDELGVLTALGLLTAGMWHWLQAGALVVPGVVLLYLVLPARGPFVAPTPDPRKR